MQRIPMASGYPGTGSSVYGGGGGGMLKRSASELERQQQMQQALLLRSVKQRTNNCSPDEVSLSSSSSGFNFRNPYPQPEISFLESEKKSSMRNQLQELERQLLLDEDEDDAVSVAAGSAVTTSEWSEAMDRLLSPPPPAPMMITHNNAPSPSPSTSTSSSSASSTASCSPSLSASRQLLLDTATAIADGNIETAASNLAALKHAANVRGDPDQRLTAMMLSALLNRTTSSSSPSSSAAHPFAELCSLEHQTATQMMYDISPCFKLGLMAANLAILDATRGNPKIHVMDFDIGQGGQYPALIHAVAERSRQIPSLPPPSLKITAVSDPTFSFATPNSLMLIGDKIAKLSNRLGLDVRFRVVDKRTSELDATTLGCERGEALAVNFSFVLSKIADESVSPANPRDELLRRVRSLGPKVVTVVEQEINFNTAPFPARFTEACSYYGSLLDSLDATAGRDSAERARVEACLGRKVANAVAREGPDRIERPEVFGKWRARMGMAGLRPVELGPAVVEPVRSRFGSFRSVPGFTFKEEAGGLGFGWMGRVLTVASAWR